MRKTIEDGFKQIYSLRAGLDGLDFYDMFEVDRVLDVPLRAKDQAVLDIGTYRLALDSVQGEYKLEPSGPGGGEVLGCVEDRAVEGG